MEYTEELSREIKLDNDLAEDENDVEEFVKGDIILRSEALKDLTEH